MGVVSIVRDVSVVVEKETALLVVIVNAEVEVCECCGCFVVGWKENFGGKRG